MRQRMDAVSTTTLFFGQIIVSPRGGWRFTPYLFFYISVLTPLSASGTPSVIVTVLLAERYDTSPPISDS